MSLYDDIGADEDASPADLKRAYRATAKQTHPDKPGGDRDKFERASRAWMVLSDPAMRERYDRTGTADAEPDNTMGMVASMMGAMFDEAMTRARGQFEIYDLVEGMVEIARERLAHVREEIRKGEKARDRTSAMIKRARRRGKGANLLAAILTERRDGISKSIRDLERSRDGFEALIVALADYEWEVDRQEEQIDIEMLLAASMRDKYTNAGGC
jgi:curved DNA-binding protein CbpA